jgi:hypothetical protein
MVADSYYYESVPTGNVRLIKKMFGLLLQEEVAVYCQPMNPYSERKTKPSYYEWRKKRLKSTVVWESPRPMPTQSSDEE